MCGLRICTVQYVLLQKTDVVWTYHTKSSVYSSFYNNNKIVENSHLQVIFLYVKGTVSQDSSSSDPFIDMLRYFQIWFLFCIHCTTFCAFFPQCHRRRRVNFMASMPLWSQKYYLYLFKSFFSGIKGGCFVKFWYCFYMVLKSVLYMTLEVRTVVMYFTTADCFSCEKGIVEVYVGTELYRKGKNLAYISLHCLLL